MLVLTRKIDETISMPLTREVLEALLATGGGDVEITVVKLQGDKVRLGVTAPACLKVMRKELLTRAASELVAGNIAPKEAEHVSGSTE